MADFRPKNDAEILKKIKEGGGSSVVVSNATTDTEDMNKALNSVQANENVEGTLANRISNMYTKSEIDEKISNIIKANYQW